MHAVQFEKAAWRRFWGLCIETFFCFMWTFFFFFPNTPTRTCTHQGARLGNDCLSVLAGGGEPFRVRSACGNYSAQFRPTPPPATPLSCGCSSQKMLNTTSLLICSPSDVLLPPTHKRRGRGRGAGAGSPPFCRAKCFN